MAGGSEVPGRRRHHNPVDHPDELPEPPAGGSGVVVPTPWVAPLGEPGAFLSFARLASHGEPSEESILGP